MFKTLLSATPQLSPKASAPSPSSLSSSPKREKNSLMKAVENNQASSQEKVSIADYKGYTNVNEKKNDKYNIVPDLILPPSSPSEIALLSKGIMDRIPSSRDIHRGHSRDDSLETTYSQSMDLSSFIKSLEMQQGEQKKQQLGNDNKKDAPAFSFTGCDKSHDESLSFAASQVDMSLEINAETIQLKSDGSEGESKLSSDNNNDSSNENPKAEKNIDPETVILKEPIAPLAIDDVASPLLSHARLATSDSCDPHSMANVGEQLFRESFLKTGEEKSNKKETESTKTETTPEPLVSKRNTFTKLIAFAVIIVVLLFGNKWDVRPEDVTETAISMTECDSIKPQSQNFAKPDLHVEDFNSFQNADYPHVSSTSTNQLFADRQDNDDDGLPDPAEPSTSMADDATQHGSSKRLYEDPEIEKEIHLSKSNVYGSHSAERFVFFDLITILIFVGWPVPLLLFMAHRFMSSKTVIKSKMENKTPVTPNGASSGRKRHGFLTPPSFGKNRAKEPSAWMSPCYGEDAIDISVYQSMKHATIRELLRNRKCDTRGNKEKSIKILIMSYQNELACLTVQQLRPKLRRRKLSQKGTKKDIIRRLVEAGPIIPTKF